VKARIRRAGAAVVAAARDWAPDAMLLGGAAAVSYGAGLVYAPAGFIVGGVLLLVGGYRASRRAGV
jgi:hypothetical protein